MYSEIYIVRKGILPSIEEEEEEEEI